MRAIARLSAIVLVSLATALAGTPPPVTAQQAAKIADDYLRDLGILDSTYIASITLEQAALFKKDTHWFVAWDEPLPVPDDKRKEVGLKITMEGKLTRLVR